MTLFPDAVLDRTPTHVIAQPGDRLSLCGIKDSYPYVVAEFVAAHVEGWGMVVCPECAASHPVGGTEC